VRAGREGLRMALHPQDEAAALLMSGGVPKHEAERRSREDHAFVSPVFGKALGIDLVSEVYERGAECRRSLPAQLDAPQ